MYLKTYWHVAASIVYVLLFLVMTSCGGSGEGGNDGDGQPIGSCGGDIPTWMNQDSADSSENHRFRALSEGYTMEQARENAIGLLKSQISQSIFMDVYVESEHLFTATELNEEETYLKSELTDMIQTNTFARLTDFKVDGEYCEEVGEGDDKRISYHVYCDYPLDSLAKAKADCEAYFHGVAQKALDFYLNAQEALKYNQVGRTLELIGKATENLLLVSYGNETLDHPEIKNNFALESALERLLLEVVENTQLRIVSGNNQSGQMKGSLSEPLVIQAVYRNPDTNEQSYVDKLGVRFEFDEPNGTLDYERHTDNEGKARCTVTDLENTDDSVIVNVSATVGPVQDSFPALKRLDKQFTFAVRGRGVLVVSYVEFVNTGSAINSREQDTFTPMLVEILQNQGLSNISEHHVTDKNEFMRYHTNNVDALNRLKSETGATDVLTCYVECRTTGSPQTIMGYSNLFFFGDVQIKVFSGPDCMVTYEYIIEEDQETKLGIPADMGDRGKDRCLNKTRDVLETRLSSEDLHSALN